MSKTQVFKHYSDVQALPGTVEVISEKQYSKSAALIRAKGGIPKDCTAGGVPIIMLITPDCRWYKPSPSGRISKKYHVLWHVPNPPRGDELTSPEATK